MIATDEPAGPPATDAAVIEQSWAAPERFEAIFRRYFGQVHRYLAARVGGRIADDLAAEVFTLAFAQRQRYDLARDCARPWLYGIATNLVGSYRRREQRRYRALARIDARGVAPSDEDLVAERVSAAAARPALAAALAGLGSGDRDVLLLVALAGLDRQHTNAGHRIIGVPLITGDGTKLAASFFHLSARPKVFGFTITEFSVQTGKVVRVLYRKRTDTEGAATAVLWVNKSGTALIAVRGNVYGVQTLTTFTPLPQRTQRLIAHRLPAW